MTEENSWTVKAHRGKGAGKTAGLVEAEQTAEGGGIGRVGD